MEERVHEDEVVDNYLDDLIINNRSDHYLETISIQRIILLRFEMLQTTLASNLVHQKGC